MKYGYDYITGQLILSEESLTLLWERLHNANDDWLDKSNFPLVTCINRDLAALQTNSGQILINAWRQENADKLLQLAHNGNMNYLQTEANEQIMIVTVPITMPNILYDFSNDKIRHVQNGTAIFLKRDNQWYLVKESPVASYQPFHLNALRLELYLAELETAEFERI
ncbi:MAG: hypothetical protein ACKKL5_02855 [Candidatus Komeilibacteria bacterium]